MLNQSPSLQLVREQVGGETYEYIPLGKHIVIAPALCGGRPTFKYTRLEVSVILTLLATGDTIEQLLIDYAASHLTREAVQEAIRLAETAFAQSSQTIYPIAA